MTLEKFQQDDVAGWDTVRITSQGSVSSVEPAVHVFIINDAFDEEFAEEIKVALRNLRERIKNFGSVA
jgi:hypothetical protein